jgi:septal ring factor EnvC (AmiA/AmiB activator)
MSGSGSNLAALTQRLREAAQQGDSEVTWTACRALVEHARATCQIPPAATVRELLALLRSSRRFEALAVLAEALIRMGREEPIVLRFDAQGLIDQALLIAARGVLQGLLRRATSDPTEHVELRGLMAA